MKFRPLHDRVVIRRAESDTTSKGGIIIPDNAKEKPQEGEVIAVGPGARDESGALIALDVKAGDLILFGKWSGTEVKIDGEDLLIMKEADIMGIIDKSEMGIIDKSEMGIIDKSEMGIIERTGATKKAA
ncbi:co-chaperone GroES [Mesorhizobium sp.]|uniref:co-chaperone GroES n=1 Tax=Mesorhizobium sp. TaxID=1871066 RepID=UPI000FE76A4C|nr:co-chaperone GroES [Mesorhizobium sp.]RWQ04593.1 MAG: co-chaperone GroES [Mesorhizobium sp.]